MEGIVFVVGRLATPPWTPPDVSDKLCGRGPSRSGTSHRHRRGFGNRDGPKGMTTAYLLNCSVMALRVHCTSRGC